VVETRRLGIRRPGMLNASKALVRFAAAQLVHRKAKTKASEALP
jgi:hypothetical protein